jgi:hypothetical protein
MTKEQKDIAELAGLIIAAMAIVVFGPLAIVWSINTLFPVAAIPYNFWTWLATVFLSATWMSKKVINKN